MSGSTTGAAEALAGFLMRLRARGHRDGRLLAAVERAPRELFLPGAPHPYAPHALPLPCGQEAPAPEAEVAAVALLAPLAGERVLEVGTGSGWTAALLARLAREVVSLERYRRLAGPAGARLAALGLGDARALVADGLAWDGGAWDGGAPFDAVLVGGAVAAVPAALLALVAPGGRLLAPVGEGAGARWRLHRHGEGVAASDHGAADLPPLVPGLPAAL